MGSKVEHTFRFTNNGNTPLLINSVKAGCGCTVLKGWPKTPIKPGEKGEIPVVLNTKRTGYIKNIFLYWQIQDQQLINCIWKDM